MNQDFGLSVDARGLIQQLKNNLVDRYPRDSILKELLQNADDAEANFVFGLILLERDDPAGAARALRRALHYDPSLGLAAFTLGRACDRLGDAAAARAAAQVIDLR